MIEVSLYVPATFLGTGRSKFEDQWRRQIENFYASKASLEGGHFFRRRPIKFEDPQWRNFYTGTGAQEAAASVWFRVG
jgi:hypothetical protein